MLWAPWSAIVRGSRLGANVKSHFVGSWMSQRSCAVLKAVAHIVSRRLVFVGMLVRAPL
jgi:hypothetical protein